MDNIRNDIDLNEIDDQNDDWNDEPTSQQDSQDMTYEELADIVMLLQPQQ